jgi:hypothetical protein
VNEEIVQAKSEYQQTRKGSVQAYEGPFFKKHVVPMVQPNCWQPGYDIKKVQDWRNGTSQGRLLQEDFMNILAAIGREEKKVKKQLAKLQQDLIGLQSAATALGKSANRDLTVAKKRVLSAAARAKISRATKKRWAKLRAQAKKTVA